MDAWCVSNFLTLYTLPNRESAQNVGCAESEAIICRHCNFCMPLMMLTYRHIPNEAKLLGVGSTDRIVWCRAQVDEKERMLATITNNLCIKKRIESGPIGGLRNSQT